MPKKNFIAKFFQGWGMMDIIILLIALCGAGAFIWVYLFGDTTLIKTDAWEVEAQAYEETVGQVKVIGTIKNVSKKVQKGYIVLELRCFNEAGDLIWNEFATMQNSGIESGGEAPFAFVIQKPEGLAYFNVRAATLGGEVEDMTATTTTTPNDESESSTKTPDSDTESSTDADTAPSENE